MSGRGALWMVWGIAADGALRRSIASFRDHHPELPVHVARLPAAPGQEAFGALAQKARMAELSPFAETVFLDADTVVLGRLDHGFAMAKRHGIALTICECPWARRYAGTPASDADRIEYNTGVVFFTPARRALFEAWRRLCATIDSNAIHVETPDGSPARMPFNDQAAFSAAVEQLRLSPFILPPNWNYRPRWSGGSFGPIRIWHSYRDVPAEVHRINAFYARPGAILQFHRLDVSP